MGKYKISGGESFSKPKAKTIKEKLIDLTPKRFKTYLQKKKIQLTANKLKKIFEIHMTKLLSYYTEFFGIL